jgi:2',3'-cyclic-nucleotide 2'-phosphodiesterase (5'-nucleotidase family)
MKMKAQRKNKTPKFLSIYCFFLILGLTAFSSCRTTPAFDTSYQKIKFNDTTLIASPELSNLIAPYKQQLEGFMNDTIGMLEGDLYKSKPEGSLGNFVCDELLSFARMHSSQPIDFCFFNNGGLRVQSLSKGALIVKNIYELLPFENTLEIIKLDGATCLLLLHKAAEEGGVPVSGIRFSIVDAHASDVVVQEQPFDPAKSYFILTNDYLANGGEPVMKNTLQRISLPFKLREALIEHLRSKYALHQSITPVTDGRISQNK